jgi:hypothetical protein
MMARSALPTTGPRSSGGTRPASGTAGAPWPRWLAALPRAADPCRRSAGDDAADRRGSEEHQTDLSVFTTTTDLSLVTGVMADIDEFTRGIAIVARSPER